MLAAVPQCVATLQANVFGGCGRADRARSPGMGVARAGIVARWPIGRRAASLSLQFVRSPEAGAAAYSLLLEPVGLEPKRPAVLAHGSNDRLVDAVGYANLNLEHHVDLGVGQRGEMLDDLLRDAPGVAANPQ